MTVSNYFYADTVEQNVYAGIRDHFGNFTEIVGDAQPVLARDEQAIRAAAMVAPEADTDAAVAAAVTDIKEKVQAATSGAVRLSDAEQHTLAIPELHPSATLAHFAACRHRQPRPRRLLGGGPRGARRVPVVPARPCLRPSSHSTGTSPTTAPAT